MNTLVFDIRGSFAHFRKFYANSTSLSYEFPPRTVISGLIAGIAGMGRDSYYERMAEREAFIAVQILTPVKRISQTVNYMWVKSSKDLNGSGGPMQIPVEWIVNQHGIGSGHVAYRIYFAHRDPSFFEQVSAYVREERSIYPPYLGSTEAIASLSYVGEVSADYVKTDEAVDIATVCPIHLLQDITYEFLDTKQRIYMRDRIPCSFDNRRKLSGITQVICEPGGKSILARPKEGYVRLELNGSEIRILPLISEQSEGNHAILFPS